MRLPPNQGCIEPRTHNIANVISKEIIMYLIQGHTSTGRSHPGSSCECDYISVSTCTVAFSNIQPRTLLLFQMSGSPRNRVRRPRRGKCKIETVPPAYNPSQTNKLNTRASSNFSSIFPLDSYYLVCPIAGLFLELCA